MQNTALVVARDAATTSDPETEETSRPEESGDISIITDSGWVFSGVTSIRYATLSTELVTLKNTIQTIKGRRDERTMVIAPTPLQVGRFFEQDPDAVLEYVLDFSNVLEGGERLLGTAADMRLSKNPSFTYSPGLTLVSRSLTSNTVTVWLRGGEPGGSISRQAPAARTCWRGTFQAPATLTRVLTTSYRSRGRLHPGRGARSRGW